MTLSTRRAAACLAACLFLADASHALTASDLKWDLTYATALKAYPIGANEAMRSWLVEHPDRPIQKKLPAYAGEPIEASLLFERPDNHAGDPLTLWVVKTRTTAQACSFHPKLADEPCRSLDPARAEAFVRQVMAMKPDMRQISDDNVIDHDGPGGQARLLNYFAFVSVFVDGKSLQRPVPTPELVPTPNPLDPDAGQLQTAIDQLFLTPAQLNERDGALQQEARRIAAAQAVDKGDLKALAQALAADAGHPLDLSALLASAAGQRRQATVDLLLQHGAGIDATESAALKAAVQADDADMVEHLLARGAKVDPPPSSLQRNTALYETALSVAARNGNAAIAKVLIAHGADVNIEQSRPIVIGAAGSHDLATLDLVLTAGARPEATGRYEPETALMETVRVRGTHPGKGTTEQVVRRLLAAGADINFTNRICDTAYSQATRLPGGDGEAALLVSLGADPGRAAACRAQQAHRDVTARVEMQAQDDVVRPTRRALAAGDYAALDALYATLRVGDQRTPSGLRKRAIYFEQMRRFAYRQRDPAYWAQMESRAAKWREAFPQSVPARLFQADLRLLRTQVVRGDGDWSAVPAADRLESRRLATEAMAWLQDAKAMAADEPEWDRDVLDFLPYTGATPAQSFAEAQRAIKRHPGYLPLVATAVWYVGDDWHGSKQMVEQLVREATAAAAASEGRATYARVYWYLDDNMYHSRIFNATGARWVDMKAGFDDMLKAWPDAWNLNAYAYFACAAGDRATLAALLQRIGDDVVAPVWGNKGMAFYDLCKKNASGS